MSNLIRNPEMELRVCHRELMEARRAVAEERQRGAGAVAQMQRLAATLAAVVDVCLAGEVTLTAQQLAPVRTLALEPSVFGGLTVKAAVPVGEAGAVADEPVTPQLPTG